MLSGRGDGSKRCDAHKPSRIVRGGRAAVWLATLRLLQRVRGGRRSQVNSGIKTLGFHSSRLRSGYIQAQAAPGSHKPSRTSHPGPPEPKGQPKTGSSAT